MTIETPHAHQMYVAIAAETGLVGLLGIVLIIGLGIRWYLPAPQEAKQRAWPYGLGLLIIAFPLNSQPVLFIPWWFPVMLLLFCTMLAALEPESPD
jgi:O-antigen ligase